MEDVISRMSDEKLLGLAALLDLHDLENPERKTTTHVWAAKGSNGEVPFKDLNRPAREWELQHELSRAGGHTVANMARAGSGVSYREIVKDVAKHFKVSVSSDMTIEQAEGAVTQAVIAKIVDKLSPEQKADLEKHLEEEAAKHGKSFVGEGGALAALLGAELAGFSLFVGASTVVGAVTGFLGITLPFAFYTTMSSVLGVIVGPVGWAALGFAAVWKLGAPNMKKLLGVVMYIAAERAAPSAS